MIELIGKHTSIKTEALLSATKQEHKITVEYINQQDNYLINGFIFTDRKSLNVYLLRLANILNNDIQGSKINIGKLLSTKDSYRNECFKISN